MFTWEGWDAQGHHLEYHNKYGEYPNFSIFGDEEEAFAKIRAGAQFDVTHPCSYKVEIWRDAGILQPIDVSRLSHWDEIIPSLKEIPGMTTGDGVWFVPADWGLTSVLYRPDLVDPAYQEEETWGILWDERYRGRLSMSDSLIDGVMVAAIYGGAKDPFNMTPDEVEVTRELLRRQLPLLRYYWDQPHRSRELDGGGRAGRDQLVERRVHRSEGGRRRREVHDAKGRRHDVGVRVLPHGRRRPGEDREELRRHRRVPQPRLRGAVPFSTRATATPTCTRTSSSPSICSRSAACPAIPRRY